MFNFFKKKSYLKKFSRNIYSFKNSTNVKKILNPSCINFIEKIYDNNIDDYNNVIKKRDYVNINNKYRFRNDTKKIRESLWKIDNIPDNLKIRHVEITGPGNNKRMIINALNSNANGYMLDLEDSMTPSWSNIINGHYNINLAVRKELKDKKMTENGMKVYSIKNYNQPTFFVRTRGLHMTEENLKFNNKSVPATIFDISTFLFNNAEYLLKNNMGPYLYIPKLESYEDALLINNIINDCENELSLPKGSVKVTCLIETFPAIFQTEEIIYALRDNIVALNCGRWDYLYSMIKSLGNQKVMDYRDELSMDKPFLESYVNQIVSTCHKRGILAIGGMSAFIPTNDKEKNKEILRKIYQDKELEIKRGCDGAWVAHPGLIDPIKELFESKMKDNQMHIIKETNYNDESFTNFESSMSVTELELKKNINISLQYISAWLSGNGAVAINNLMEDLATSEISVFQIKQWLNSRHLVQNDEHHYDLNNDKLNELIDNEFNYFLKSNQVMYANKHFYEAREILKEYVFNNHNFLPDVGTKYLNMENNFKSVTWDKDTYNRISGSKGYLSGIELTKHRGNYLNKFLYEDKNPAYKFLGTSNGVSAVNVVAGGNGKVGPYAGGWQTNAMKNRLGMLLPDTLHVSPEEAANCAEEINNHLHRADAVQHIQKLDNPKKMTNSYYDLALLADMEQGWNTPEKTRISVIKAIQNGINVIHIEDQGEKKRCGHLGDKELNIYDDYALILRSANLAAQELLGPEQAEKHWVRFVARTDAYSAKRIVNSNKLYDPDNLEHKFVDWKRGPTPDGKYLYLKQGVNPETGRKWGLDLSIERCARVVDDGLASHVWMETPDADLHVAKDFLVNVNKILSKKGKKANGLYNHSPSFDWDVKFFAEADELSTKIINNFCNSNMELTFDNLKEFIMENGDHVKGDHLFTDENLKKILINCKDHRKGNKNWKLELRYIVNQKDNNYPFANMKKKLKEELDKGFRPREFINEIIVDQRLDNFGIMLSSFGFDMHLITLPEFHVTAFNMHKLSQNFANIGINAFVKTTQREERIKSENDYSFTYYKHQTATGTGVEAAFNNAVGSYDVNTLEDSTEQDDIKTRK